MPSKDHCNAEATTGRTARRPRRGLWEQVRDRLLRESGLSLDLLARAMDATAGADGWRDGHTFLAFALHAFLAQPKASRAAQAEAFFAWNQAACDARRRGESPPDIAPAAGGPARPKRPSVVDGTAAVTIAGTQWKLCISPEPMVGEDGTRGMAHIDHARKLIWFDPALSRNQAIRIGARAAAARAWAEVRDRKKARRFGAAPAGPSDGDRPESLPDAGAFDGDFKEAMKRLGFEDDEGQQQRQAA